MWINILISTEGAPRDTLRLKTANVVFVTVLIQLICCLADAIPALKQHDAQQQHSTMTEKETAAFRIILTQQELNAFDRHENDHEKAEWARIYWIQQDPTPFSQRNERLEEHRRRVSHAQSQYSAFTLTGFDDRGIIYVRYGEPTVKHVQPLGIELAKANESWSYTGLHTGLTFDFVSDGTSYKLTNNLRKLVVARDLFNPILAERAALVSLFQDRAHLDKKYAEAVVALELAEDNSRDLDQIVAQFASESDRARVEAPRVTYSEDPQAEIDLTHSWARFKGPNNTTRLEIYYGLPVRQLSFSLSGGHWVSRIESKMALLDSSYHRISSDSTLMELRTATETETQIGLYGSQMNIHVKPGSYRTIVQILDLTQKKMGVVQTDIDCISYSSDSLMISDIQLSSAIVEGTGDLKNRYTKKGLRITPIPGNAVLKNKSLFLYFEIYGLVKGVNGATRYDLEYSLKTVKPKKGIFKRIFGVFGGKRSDLAIAQQRQGHSIDQVEYVALDLSKQKTGRYELAARVLDVNANRAVESRRIIELK